MSKGDKISVAIRVRPLITSEKESGAITYWTVKDSKCVAHVNAGSNKFHFDYVFDSDKDNEDVYNVLCHSIVESFIQGFNGTIFAYGQTSSGKTYTMMGKNIIYKGIIHYAIEDIFDTIQETPDREFLLRVSVLEIYNEKVYDLLSDKNEELKLLTDSYGVVNVSGLVEKIVQTPDQIWNLMNKGQAKRRTGATKLNINSSRSHFIFRMILESRLRGDEEAVVNVSQLNLVDLAGSENAKLAKTEGERLKEGISINKSLLTLSQVISDLTNKKQKDRFTNFRNSKLTRLLQNSLGGNARTAMVCTITPASEKESHSTLTFAQRVKKIENEPKKNEIFNDEALLKQYANQIKKLSEELEASKEQGKELEEKTKQNENLKRQIEALKANFVSQKVKAKVNRRGTWGGGELWDPRKFFEPQFPLPQISEESELDTESLDTTEPIFRQRSSSSSTMNLSTLSKKFLNVETQTDPDMLELNTDIDDAMSLVRELKSQLTFLQNEFAELYEYTTLEKQLLKAENELQVEIEALKQENNFLKKSLESSSPTEKSHLVVPTELKEKENNLSRHEVYECIDSKVNHETLDYNDFSHQSSNSLISQKATQKIKETSKMDLSGSTLLDESLKSNFLAFYDEYVESAENEVVSSLKSEIENLKYNIELKNKQIKLLNDKMMIKEQFIMSLKSEIALGKNIDSPNKNDKSMTEKIVQIDEFSQTDFTTHSLQKILSENESQTSPLKLCETSSSDCYKLNNFSKLDACTEMSPSRFSVIKKCVMEDQLTQVTPIKLKEVSIQYYTNEGKTEHCVQTSPIKGLELFSDNLHEEHGDIDQCDQCTQVTDSFIADCNKRSVIDTEDKNCDAYNDQSVQTSYTFSEGKHEEVNLIMDKSYPLNSTQNVENSVFNCLSDEMKVVINKVTELKIYVCNFMKNCTKVEYLKNSDIFESNCDPISAHKEIADLENLIITLESYIKNVEEDCKIIKTQLESKFQENIQLNLKLSDAVNALEVKESEISRLCKMFFDLKQNFSNLTLICQVLNNVESVDEFAEIKESVIKPVSPQSCIPDYEMTLFKKLFVKLSSYMEENASKIISLSEDLKKAKSEISALQKEKDLKSFDNSNVHLKSTLSKSIQTSPTLDTADVFENEEIILNLKNEIKYLKEQNNELEQCNKGLKQEIDDLEKDLEAAKADWQAKALTLVQDVEEKYDKELIDQENKLTQELHSKIFELKQEHFKQLHNLKGEIAENKMLHDRELSDMKKHFEDQLFSENSEKENLKHQLNKEKEQKVQAIKAKYDEKLTQCKEVNSRLKKYVEHYLEEIEKLKKETHELTDERDLLQKKCTKADQETSELKEYISHLKRKLKNVNNEELKQNPCCKNKEIEEINKRLLYELDEKKAKIMTLQANNTSMVQEVKKLNEILSSKAAVNNCKCKSNSKDPKSDIPEKHEDKKGRKSKSNCKNDLDIIPENPAFKERSLDNNNETPKQSALNSNTPVLDQKYALCVGGGSGSASMVKCYWLEGKIHEKDKEIVKLTEELTELRSQLKNMKIRPLINEEKQPEVKKPEIKRTPISPLQEADENITVQVKNMHPYQGGMNPKVQRIQKVKEKNGMTSRKPYDKPQTDYKMKENAAPHSQPPTSGFHVNRHGPKTQQDAIDQLANPECKQQ